MCIGTNSYLWPQCKNHLGTAGICLNGYWNCQWHQDDQDIKIPEPFFDSWYSGSASGATVYSWSLWYPPLLISRIFLPWNYSNRSVLLLPWRNGYESGRKPSQNHCYYYKLTNSENSIVVSSEWVQTGSEHRAVRCAGWPSHSCLAWPGHMTYPDQSEAGPTKRPIRSQ